MPADLQERSALVLACNDLVDRLPGLMLQLADACIDRVPIVAIVDDESQRRQVIVQLTDWGLPAHEMRFLSLPLPARRRGLAFSRTTDGSLAILDCRFDADDAGAARGKFAALLATPLLPMPLAIERGDLLSNGHGLAIATSAFLQRNARRGFDLTRVRAILNASCGINQLVVLNPLVCEPTGHVDLFATFTGEQDVVVGAYDRAIDPVNADCLDDNARLLAAVIHDGRPLNVHRIAMPSNQDGVWRTYTAPLYVNGALIVACYAAVDRAILRSAIDVYAALLPSCEIWPLDVSKLAACGQTLRDVACPIPSLLPVSSSLPTRRALVSA